MNVNSNFESQYSRLISTRLLLHHILFIVDAVEAKFGLNPDGLATV